MITAIIKNIVSERNGFVVFVEFSDELDNPISQHFAESDARDQVESWILGEIARRQTLETKVADLRSLVGLVLPENAE